MAIRLLCEHGRFPANAVVTLDAATEAGLVNAKMATFNTAGGIVHFPDSSPRAIAPGLLAAQIAEARRNQILIAPQGAETATYANFATFTWLMIVQSPVPFDAIMPITSHAAPNDIPGLAICAAAGGDLGDKTGNGLAWVDATFGGAATGTQKGGQPQRPGLTAPDTIPVACVPRTDGGSGFLGYIRVCVPTGGTMTASLSVNTDLVQLNGLASGMVYSSRAPGDFVTTAKSAFNPGGSRGDSPITCVVLLSRGQCLSLLSCGDSITRAMGATLFKSRNMFEIAARKVSMAKSGIAVTSANFGWASQKTSQYFARLMDILAMVKPTAAVYAAFSPNEDPSTGVLTQAMVDGMRFRAGQFVEYCRANQIIPVLWTGLPALKGWSSDSDNRRKIFNAELRTLYGSVALISDLDSVLTDGATPASILPGLSDGTHPYDNGNAILAERFSADVLTPILNAMT